MPNYTGTTEPSNTNCHSVGTTQGQSFGHTTGISKGYKVIHSICDYDDLQKIRNTYSEILEKDSKNMLFVMNKFEKLLEKSFYNFIGVAGDSVDSQKLFHEVLFDTRDVMKSTLPNDSKYLCNMQATLNEDLSETFQKIFNVVCKIYKRKL